MREIKFRFWSNHLKRFVVPNDSIFAGALKDPDMNLMQFTGLKDRHGAEIYEGDVVERDSHDIYVVRFGEFNENGKNSKPSDSFGWFLEGLYIVKGRYPLETTEALRSIDGIGALYPRYCVENESYVMDRLGLVVIGNIYENPELPNPTEREGTV